MTTRQQAQRMNQNLADLLASFIKDGEKYLRDHARAVKTGKDVRGFTAEQLKEIGDDLIARGNDAEYSAEPAMKRILRARIAAKAAA